MAKMICLVAIIVVTGCHRDVEKKTYQDLQAQGYALALGSGFLDVQYNLENDSLKAGLPAYDIIYRDTMHLSKTEKDEIAASFFEHSIDKSLGEIEVNGKSFSSPTVADEILIYRYKKQIAWLSVVKNYEPEGFFPDGGEKRIVKFRDAVWKIFSSKRKYQTAQDSLTSAIRKTSFIRM